MKKILFIALATICCLGSYAQVDGGFDLTPEKTKNNAIFVGPTVGANMTMASGQPKSRKLFDGSGIGFTGGIAGKIRFGKATEYSPEGTGILGAGVEVKYALHSVKTNGSDDLKLGYLEVPVLIQFYPLAKSTALNGLFVEVGPEFAMLMSKNPEKLRFNVNEPYPGIQAVEYATGDLKGGDLRVAVGLGYTLPNMGLGINARYYLGTSELSKKALPTKLNTVELSLSWMFKVASF